MKDQPEGYPYITVTKGMGGYFAVMVWRNPENGGFDEPYEKGAGGYYAAQSDAAGEAEAWANDLGYAYRAPTPTPDIEPKSIEDIATAIGATVVRLDVEAKAEDGCTLTVDEHMAQLLSYGEGANDVGFAFPIDNTFPCERMEEAFNLGLKHEFFRLADVRIDARIHDNPIRIFIVTPAGQAKLAALRGEKPH